MGVNPAPFQLMQVHVLPGLGHHLLCCAACTKTLCLVRYCKDSVWRDVCGSLLPEFDTVSGVHGMRTVL